ncbi:MAG: polynucleotide adenylyltransferase PcnB [Cellvibrionales bacterium]|nr:polynucleotide adenylyltransferase PcnB [Cellvibrionales bacterium]
MTDPAPATAHTLELSEQRLPPSEHPVRNAAISPLALTIVERLRKEGHSAYVVGGCIRDLLLGNRPKDFDVATAAKPEQVRQLFHRARIIGRRFRIVHVRSQRELVEVTTFRGEHHNRTGGTHRSRRGRLLRDNVYGSLEEDAQRRDFSCNSLYFDTQSEELLDFTGGLADLRAGILRTIGDPARRFKEDPVRMLRALRFQAKLGLKLDTDSTRQLTQQAGLICDVPPARLADEVVKLLLHQQAVAAYRLLRDSGLLAALFPTPAKLARQNPPHARLLEAAMQSTEQRIKEGGRTSAFFLYAALLWPAVEQHYQRLRDSGRSPAAAMDEASRAVLAEQSARVAIGRFMHSLQDTWALQTQLPERNGDLTAHPRFRAAYNLLIMREQAGTDLQGLGDWWTQYQRDNPLPDRPPSHRPKPRHAPRHRRHHRPRTG